MYESLMDEKKKRAMKDAVLDHIIGSMDDHIADKYRELHDQKVQKTMSEAPDAADEGSPDEKVDMDSPEFMAAAEAGAHEEEAACEHGNSKQDCPKCGMGGY